MLCELELGFEVDVSTLLISLAIADIATAILIFISFIEVPALHMVDPRFLKASTSSMF